MIGTRVQSGTEMSDARRFFNTSNSWPHLIISRNLCKYVLFIYEEYVLIICNYYTIYFTKY